MEQKEKAKFIVYYDEEGKAIHIDPGEGCKIVAEGEELMSAKFFEFLKEKMAHEKIFDVKSAAIVAIHGSPGCYIYIGDKRICIC